MKQNNHCLFYFSNVVLLLVSNVYDTSNATDLTVGNTHAKETTACL